MSVPAMKPPYRTDPLSFVPCAPPPRNRPPVKRYAPSNQDAIKTQLNEGQVPASEKDKLLSNQIQANNENYGAKNSQGKLTLSPGSDANTSYDATEQSVSGQSVIQRDADSVPATNSKKLQRSGAFDHDNLLLDQLGEKTNGADSSSLAKPDGYSGSLLSSVELGPFSESVSTTISQLKSETLGTDQTNNLIQHEPEQYQVTDKGSTNADIHRSQRSSITYEQPYQPLLSPGVPAKNVPSTTKIGDYARIEYSPVEDLESLTTMSYSRLGSEKGGSQSQADSTKAYTNNGNNSRRSSQGGIESTSISIASQLSNEQFQQNLTNMLESVNSNYQTIGVIGLPLGPPIEGTLTTETTKTSPETPGAALTSASQDSLSDAAFDDISPDSSRPNTLRSNSSSTGAALVCDSMERSNMVEELAEFSQPAPLATCEDDDQPQALQANSNTSGYESMRYVERVGSPQSITTTTSGGLTNPTPTPSEMSGGSGKKKRLRAKNLLKKLRPGSKKKNKEEMK